jgi:phosphoglycolate phosphatase
MAAPAAVLFDLDGTLVDSAPDLAAAANDLRLARGLPPVPYEALRPHASSGARGMLGAAFGLAPGDPGYAALRVDFLARYELRMLEQTRLFDGIRTTLDALQARAVPWGIVTNKALHLAAPLARALGLLPPAAVLIGGDSTPHTKPHPAPLLEAARRLSLSPEACVYVGDDRRDVDAGRAAGMRTLAAAWGYLGACEDIHAWRADAVLEHPREVLIRLELP